MEIGVQGWTHLGALFGAFWTLCVLSYLYADNPLYKLAESAFIGLSIGYFAVVQIWDVLFPKVWRPLVSAAANQSGHWAWSAVAVALIGLFLLRWWPRYRWLSRIPVAFVVGAYAGIGVQAFARGVLLPQLRATVAPLWPTPAMRDAADLCIQAMDAPGAWARWRCTWGPVLDNAVMLVGVCAALVYFYYTRPRRGVLGTVGRVGLLFVLVGFGATLGYALSGRMAVAAGSLQRLQQQSWAAVAALVVVVAGLAAWRSLQSRRGE